MSATKTSVEVKLKVGEESFTKFIENKNRWRIRIDGTDLASGTDWEVVSPFGSVRPRIVVDADGNPLFDRPSYAEAPNINCVAYGRDREGVWRIAVVREKRPHADDPRRPGEPNEAITFAQVPMGFRDKLVGKSGSDVRSDFESAEQAATHEIAEETGAKRVLKVERPAEPFHCPNPTFVESYSELLFVEVNTDVVEKIAPHKGELICSAEYIPAKELLQNLKNGVDSQGAYYWSCTSNALWARFMACHPEVFV